MHCVEEIKNGIYWMGCNDFRTELFERIFPIPEGVTYNSYFIDDEKTCVVDAMDKSCRDEFLEDVEYLLKGRKLDYFVLQHMEPDHAANVANFLKVYPDTTVVSNMKAFNMIQNFFDLDLTGRKIEVKNGGRPLSWMKPKEIRRIFIFKDLNQCRLVSH